MKNSLLRVLILGLSLLCVTAGIDGEELEKHPSVPKESLAWVLWVPFAGEYVGGMGGDRFYDINPEHKIKFPAGGLNCLSVLSVITHQTGVAFTIDSELACGSLNTAYESSEDIEISVQEALQIVARKLAASRKETPIVDRQEKQFRSYDRRSVLLRRSLVTDIQSEEKSGTKRVIAFSLARFDVEDHVKSIGTREQKRHRDSIESNLMDFLGTGKIYHPKECKIDKILQTVWIKMPKTEIKLLHEFGF